MHVKRGQDSRNLASINLGYFYALKSQVHTVPIRQKFYFADELKVHIYAPE